MTGRNNKPSNDGPAGKPSRLDAYGDQLGSRNEEEFQEAVEQNCSLKSEDSDR
jgi:hypothetical protein